jgi:hypothetical protein
MGGFFEMYTGKLIDSKIDYPKILLEIMAISSWPKSKIEYFFIV